VLIVTDDYNNNQQACWLAFHTFLVPHFPPLQFGAVFSSPAFSVGPSIPRIAVFVDFVEFGPWNRLERGCCRCEEPCFLGCSREDLNHFPFVILLMLMTTAVDIVRMRCMMWMWRSPALTLRWKISITRGPISSLYVGQRLTTSSEPRH